MFVSISVQCLLCNVLYYNAYRRQSSAIIIRYPTIYCGCRIKIKLLKRRTQSVNVQHFNVKYARCQVCTLTKFCDHYRFMLDCRLSVRYTIELCLFNAALYSYTECELKFDWSFGSLLLLVLLAVFISDSHTAFNTSSFRTYG